MVKLIQEDVKTKIIKAAIKEFSKNGYLSASTNTIHKDAGVSKGTVFSHFHSKAELFYEVFKYCTDMVLTDYRKVDFGNIYDFFERLTAITFWKLEYFALHPEIYQVILMGLSESPPEIKDKISNDLVKFIELSGEMFFSEIDKSRFSDEYTEEEVKLFFKIALEGLQSYYLKQGVSFADFQENKDLGLKYIKTVLKGMEK